MLSHHEGVLRYWVYERINIDGLGRRFVYWAYTPRPMQLATMELNVPLDQLRGAPKISQITFDPAAIPRQKPNVPNAKTSARVEAATPPNVSATGFRSGVWYDFTLTQHGSLGMTDLL